MTTEVEPGHGSARVTLVVRGQVQGVGFRMWTRARAGELGLVGSAANRADGSVEVIAEGSRADCTRLRDLLAGGEAPGRVADVEESWSEARGDLTAFVER